MFKDHIVIVHYALLSLLGVSYSCSIVLTSVNLAKFTDETAEAFPEKQTSKTLVLQSTEIFSGITFLFEIRHEINLQCVPIYSVVQLQS